MQIGTRLSHYQIVARLGAGGMGEVYRAHDSRLRRDVAIKVLPPAAFEDAGAAKRLRREALALSRLNHPNICTVHDFDTQGGVSFIVVELIDGETLAERIRRGPVAAEEIVRIGRAIASALEVAHEQGVVHRDLKPGNVMISSKGTVKVLDFGLARDVRPAVPDATTASAASISGVFGTLPYMAPEQVLGAETDARTDVYALGTILYEMAAGSRPFEETQPLALARAPRSKPRRSTRDSPR
jgi:serine/threonine protein kinase